MKLNKIIGAFGNIGQIMEGVKNKIFKNEDIEEIARARWMDCSVCPHLDEKGDKCAVRATKPCCGKCGCSMSLKTRALSSACPIGKWAAVIDPKTEHAIKKQIRDKDASNI